MIKRFCDCCGVELNKKNTIGEDTGSMQPRIKKGKSIRVRISIVGTGDFCKYCAIDAIKNLDDRPKSKES